MPVRGEMYSGLLQEKGEERFFCLLADDRLITKVSVETDQMLEFVGPTPKLDDVCLVITVRLRPYELTLDNMQYG